MGSSHSPERVTSLRTFCVGSFSSFRKVLTSLLSSKICFSWTLNEFSIEKPCYMMAWTTKGFNKGSVRGQHQDCQCLVNLPSFPNGFRNHKHRLWGVAISDYFNVTFSGNGGNSCRTYKLNKLFWNRLMLLVDVYSIQISGQGYVWYSYEVWWYLQWGIVDQTLKPICSCCMTPGVTTDLIFWIDGFSYSFTKA